VVDFALRLQSLVSYLVVLGIVIGDEEVVSMATTTMVGESCC